MNSCFSIRKLVFIVIILIFSIETFSQEIIKGRIFEISNKTKKLLSSVSIYTVIDTLSYSTDSNGYFEIKTPSKYKGNIPKPYIRKIGKEGYMVINENENEIELKEKTSNLEVLMCKQEAYNTLFNKFKNIGISNYKDGNKFRLNEFMIQKEEKIISKKKYNELLSNYYDDYISYQKSINNTSDYMVRICLSEFDSIYQNCISLLLDNKIQEATDLCLKQNYTQLYIDSYDKSEKEYYKQHIDFEINLLRFSSLSDKYEKISDIYYKLAIYNLESIPILMEYANFLYEQRKFDKAIDWYNQIIKRNNSPFIYANINNILGSIYFIKEEYSKSEELYLSAIEILDSIITENYYSYSPTKADVLTNLATLYKSTRNYNEALNPFEEALKINKEFSFLYPEKYISQYAINIINLASLHNELGNDSLSINLYTEAISLFDSISLLNKDEYKIYHATSLNNLGLIFYKNQKYQQAIDLMDLSSSIFEQLSNEYPIQYLSQLATIKLNLASICKETSNHLRAEKLYLETIDIFSKLKDIKPIESLSQISSTQNILGLLYSSIGEYVKSEKILNEALEIRKLLAKIDLDNNLAKVADIQNNLGNVYEYTEKYNKAIEMYYSSLDIYETLAKNGYYFTEKTKEIEENIKRLNQLYNKSN